MDAAGRRRTARLAVAAAAVVALLVLLAQFARREPPAPPPVTASTPSAAPSAGPSAGSSAGSSGEPSAGSSVPPVRVPPAPARPPELDALLTPDGWTRVPTAGDGTGFTAEALGEDGTLVGRDGNGSRAGLVQPGSPAVRWLAGSGASSGFAAGSGLVAWIDRADGPHAVQVFCARAPENWRPVQISGSGVRSLVSVDGGSVAWTDETGAAWHSVDCGQPRRLRVGDVVAVAGSDVFVRAGGQVDRYDLETDRSRPTSIAFEGAARFAASETYVVWAHAGRLTVYDRATGEIRRLADELPAGDAVSLTVGRRLVAYTSRAGTSRSVVLDLRGNARVELGAEAFAAGDRLAWREADHYSVAGTRR